MILRGANLGDVETEYRPLVNWKYEVEIKQLELIQNIYIKATEESTRFETCKMSQENGKVIIKPGMLIHRCSHQLDTLENISKYGILASEWFGQKESEGEGVFCAFLSEIHDESKENDSLIKRGKAENIRALKGINGVRLFIDNSHPTIKTLMHYDYFEYEKTKSEGSEKISALYTPDEIKLFETVIEPHSKGGVNMHKSGIPYCNWHAIIGGIPASLINGISIGAMKVTEEYIQNLSKLFPNATIFNSDLEIIHHPLKTNDDNNTKIRN